jgi:hypothetical protein
VRCLSRWNRCGLVYAGATAVHLSDAPKSLASYALQLESGDDLQPARTCTRTCTHTCVGTARAGGVARSYNAAVVQCCTAGRRLGAVAGGS